ncbi:MAG: stage V sporulation protein AA [Eubacteriales bacterium]|nr:stage V sporulation protein AA [Eubacteriales bacterium]
MSKTVYLKIEQCVDVEKEYVKLKDFATLYCDELGLKNEIENIHFFQFEKNKKSKMVVSILKIIEEITRKYPNVEIQNIGESDFILSYNPTSKWETLKEWGATIFICATAFLGGGYAIMAYNTDVGAKELFSNLSMLFFGNAKTGVTIITIAYSIGLFFGMILFFNHLGGKRLNSDPTPLEIQMRLYEQDLNQTIIQETSRNGDSIDIKE